MLLIFNIIQTICEINAIIFIFFSEFDSIIQILLAIAVDHPELQNYINLNTNKNKAVRLVADSLKDELRKDSYTMKSQIILNILNKVPKD